MALSNVPLVSGLYGLVVKQAAYRWEELCLGLLVNDKDGAKLAAIRRDFIQQGVEMCCLQVFLDWIKGGGALPVSWGTVITCLHDMEMHRLAEDVERAVQEDATSDRNGA
jgi:hypothetical protein